MVLQVSCHKPCLTFPRGVRASRRHRTLTRSNGCCMNFSCATRSNGVARDVGSFFTSRQRKPLKIYGLSIPLSTNTPNTVSVKCTQHPPRLLKQALKILNVLLKLKFTLTRLRAKKLNSNIIQSEKLRLNGIVTRVRYSIRSLRKSRSVIR